MSTRVAVCQMQASNNLEENFKKVTGLVKQAAEDHQVGVSKVY